MRGLAVGLEALDARGEPLVAPQDEERAGTHPLPEPPRHVPLGRLVGASSRAAHLPPHVP